MGPATQPAPRLVVRVKLRGGSVIGPGKAELLERIEQCGSISAAAREMDISYRQAWLLIATLNDAFGQPLIDTAQRGRSGGGARLTTLGKRILTTYRTLQAKAEKHTRPDLAALVKLMAPDSRPRAKRRRVR